MIHVQSSKDVLSASLFALSVLKSSLQKGFFIDFVVLKTRCCCSICIDQSQGFCLERCRDQFCYDCFDRYVSELVHFLLVWLRVLSAMICLIGRNGQKAHINTESDDLNLCLINRGAISPLAIASPRSKYLVMHLADYDKLFRVNCYSALLIKLKT